MNIKLEQFKLFSNLAAQLAAVTAEQLVTVEAGPPLEAGQTPVGTLPDHLKALLYLRDQIADTANKIIRALPAARPRSDEELDDVLTRLADLKAASKKANALFWDAFRAEFPNIADKKNFGYASNFEVYYSDTPAEQKQPGMADVLRGALIVQVG